MNSEANNAALELIVEELSEVKQLLREATSRMRRIERRVEAAVPRGAVEKRSPPKQRPKIDSRRAQAIVDEFKGELQLGRPIEPRLRDLSLKPELQAIAAVLGMTNVKLPPKDDLIQSIATRLRQSVSIATGIQSSIKSGP